MTFPIGKVVVDFETNGLSVYDGARPFIVGMEDEAGTVILAEIGTKDWDIYKRICEDKTIEKICHNAKFEIKMSKHCGLNPAGKWHDTMALSVLINEYMPLNLDFMARKNLKDNSKGIISDWFKANKKSFKKQYLREPNYSDVPRDLLKKYLEGDLDKTLKLFWLWYPVIKRNKKLLALYDMEISLPFDVVRMEDRGVLCDVDFLKTTIRKFKDRQKQIYTSIVNTTGFNCNMNSTAQVSGVFAAANVPLKQNKTSTGRISMDFKDIKSLMKDHKIVSDYIEYTTIKKMLTTYLIPYSQNNYAGIIHPNYWQYGRDKAIVTGRFSSSKPSFHTIPSRVKGDNASLKEIGNSVKRAIIPRPGYSFLLFDFKQIEYRIFIHYINDEHAISDCVSGIEGYHSVACKLFGKSFIEDLYAKDNKEDYDMWRDLAKKITLALMYGMGAGLMSQQLGITVSKAHEHKNNFFKSYPTAYPFMLSVERDIINKGYCEDIFGRRYHVPTHSAYKGINALCQGSAATVLKQSMIKGRVLIPYDANLFLSLHDEMGYETINSNINTVAKIGKKIFTDKTTFKVPLEIDIEICRNNWHDKEKYKIV